MAAYVHYSSLSYVCVFQRSTDIDEFIMGDTFLKSYYVVFDQGWRSLRLLRFRLVNRGRGHVPVDCGVMTISTH